PGAPRRGRAIPSEGRARVPSVGYHPRMTQTARHPTPFGRALRQWRVLRRASQLDLSTLAETTPRHVSFLETGRSRPSREMVLRLASALDVPLAEQNALLATAGFDPAYPERDLDAAAMAPVRHVI